MISSGRQSFRRRRVSDMRYKSVSKRCVYRVRSSTRKSLKTERNRVSWTVNRFKSRRSRITRCCPWESKKILPGNIRVVVRKRRTIITIFRFFLVSVYVSLTVKLTAIRNEKKIDLAKLALA